MPHQHIRGGVTAPQGFRAAGMHCGIKPNSLPDLALIVSEQRGPIAGVFTKNRVLAAPVILAKRQLRRKEGQAILVNSGNANACTGAEGLRDANAMAAAVGTHLHIPTALIFVGSTGVIGQRLPISRIEQAVPPLIQRLTRRGHTDAAQAIMTTDTTHKETAVRMTIGRRTVTIGGMAKGSGMIHPNMATMLAYLTTDAVIAQPALQHSLREAVRASFNCISVDGETSTNDTVLCLANGQSRNTEIQAGTPLHHRFTDALVDVCHTLAMDICRDGEGATKVVQLQIEGATSTTAARRIADTLATSPLVKTALYGEDPNWGRLLAAIGRAGPPIQPNTIHIAFDKVVLISDGQLHNPAAERRAQRVMKRNTYTIRVTVGHGPGRAHVWTNDLSHDYVTINASYRS